MKERLWRDATSVKVERQNERKILTKLKNNLWGVVLDIIAVNAAFILALLLRYYVHQVFYASARRFLDTYMAFAPFYTVICLLIFLVFGLYDGITK